MSVELFDDLNFHTRVDSVAATVSLHVLYFTLAIIIIVQFSANKSPCYISRYVKLRYGFLGCMGGWYNGIPEGVSQGIIYHTKGTVP